MTLSPFPSLSGPAMAFRQNIYDGVLFCNRGPNGWSEVYHLNALNMNQAATDFLEVVTARSYVMAYGCEIVWAIVRQNMTPPPARAILTAPIPSLLKPDLSPYWLPPHDDFCGPMVSFETAEGRYANRIYHGVADDEIHAGRWVRETLTVPAGPVAAPAVPGLATKDELFTYFLATVRDKTVHARRLPTSAFGVTDWDVTEYTRAVYAGVTKRDIGSKWKRVSWEPADYLYAPAFSPCGMAVGVVRRAYEANCLFYHDGLPRRIRWYDAKPDADVFPLDTIFWPYSQMLQHSNTAGVGEFTNRVKSDWRPGLAAGVQPGDHYCGEPGDFLGVTDVPFDPSAPTPAPFLCECDLPMPLIVQESDGTPIVTDVWIIEANQAHGFSVVNLGGNRVRLDMTHPAPPAPPNVQVNAPWNVTNAFDTLAFGNGDVYDVFTPFAGTVVCTLGGGWHQPATVVNNEPALPIGPAINNRIESATPVTVKGIAGGWKGRNLRLWNIGAFPITFERDVTIPNILNVINPPNGEPVVLSAGATVDLTYNLTLNQWEFASRIERKWAYSTAPKANVLRLAGLTGGLAQTDRIGPAPIICDDVSTLIDGQLRLRQAYDAPASTIDPGDNFFIDVVATSPGLSIDGMVAKEDKTVVVLYNFGGIDFVLGFSVLSPSPNQIVLSDPTVVDPYIMHPGSFVILQYDAALPGWRARIPAKPIRINWNDVPSGAIDGVNDTFTTLRPMVTDTVTVWVNGIRQTNPGQILAGGNTIVFQPGNIPQVGDEVVCCYQW